MKLLLWLSLLLATTPGRADAAAFSLLMSAPDYTPAALRRHYEQAAADKAAGAAFYDLLRDYHGQQALVLGYKAASEAIKARDSGLLDKLTYVQQAAHTFEQAVQQDPASAEVRFLRFSVESNLPPFLGLSKHVDEDKAFLLDAALQHPRSGLDEGAFRTVREFLLQRGHVTGSAAEQLARVAG